MRGERGATAARAVGRAHCARPPPAVAPPAVENFLRDFSSRKQNREKFASVRALCTLPAHRALDANDVTQYLGTNSRVHTRMIHEV